MQTLEARLGQRTDEPVEAAVKRLGTCPGATGDEESIHDGSVGKAVVGEHGEPRLRLDRPERFRHEERIQTRVVAPSDREDAVRRRKIYDLRVLEHIDAKTKSGSNHGPSSGWAGNLLA